MWDGESTSKMILEYWDIRKRHAALQEESEKAFGVSMSLTDAVDLEMGDGMVWEWRWKGLNTSRTSTPSSSWPELLEDQSLFGGFFQMTGNDSS